MTLKIVAICGPSGAGKSAVCARLSAHLSRCPILSLDAYFRDSDSIPVEANFCDHAHVEVERYLVDVETLRSGLVLATAEVDLRTFEPTGRALALGPARDWLILEGMTLHRIERLREVVHRFFYLSPGNEAVRSRKLSRDVSERGRTQAQVEAQLQWVFQEYDEDLRTPDPLMEVIDASRPLDDVAASILTAIVAN